ncbi:MAG: TolC family protein [Bacteroidetes bacterium]|uniref:TolC family protein n=1 Tax=Candidatus Cryptobacteroides avistercoris TaxID=2840758 RepID=A0A9D9IXF6_9BACT|nr:TolC family protein [Candidatus Cryptobacteroides avistercoris]
MINLEQALQIALSENASVKVADMEIERTGYARKGTYASLFPKIDGNASYQRTIEKQVMYMDFDMGSIGGGSSSEGDGSASGAESAPATSNNGIEVGRWNTWSAGISASMPLVNAQLWKSLKISDQDVELAVEAARSSRLEMVNQVKQAYFACLLAKEAFEVYKSVYENALENYKLVEMKYNARKASELELTRAKTTLANAVPDVYNAESSVILSLWQLKAVMGVDLDENIDVSEKLGDYANRMLGDMADSASDSLSLENNSTMRQLAIQAEQLANTIKMQQFANIPTLSLSFAYNFNAMTNDFKFSEYRWSPYSYVGLTLQIPIFAGGQRHNAIRQAKVQAAELDVQRADTERQLRISIRQNLNQMETAMKSYGASLTALESAEKAYNITAKSYEVGSSTLTDLNDAQLAYTQSQLAVSQAIYDFVIAKSSLESTIGADFIDGEGNVQLNNTYDNE